MPAMLTNLVNDMLQKYGLSYDIPDANSLKLRFEDMDIQLDVDEEEMIFTIGVVVGEVPAGKYRENVFEQALIANGFPPPIFGVLSFSEQLDKLIMVHTISADEVTKDEIAEILPPLIDKAKNWKEALANASIPIVEKQSRSELPKGGLEQILGITLPKK